MSTKHSITLIVTISLNSKDLLLAFLIEGDLKIEILKDYTLFHLESVNKSFVDEISDIKRIVSKLLISYTLL